MAITNHERVGKALEFLKVGLRPYVEREMRVRYGDDWGSSVKAMLNDTRLGSNTPGAPTDVAAFLVIMDRAWGEVFRNTLGKAERSFAAFGALRSDDTGVHEATPLDNQCSALTRTAAEARCLIIVPPGRRTYGSGDFVNVDVLE